MITGMTGEMCAGSSCWSSEPTLPLLSDSAQVGNQELLLGSRQALGAQVGPGSPRKIWMGDSMVSAAAGKQERWHLRGCRSRRQIGPRDKLCQCSQGWRHKSPQPLDSVWLRNLGKWQAGLLQKSPSHPLLLPPPLLQNCGYLHLFGALRFLTLGLYAVHSCGCPSLPVCDCNH